MAWFIVPHDFPMKQFAGKRFINKQAFHKAIADVAKRHNREVTGKTDKGAIPDMPVSNTNVQFRRMAFKTYSESVHGPKPAERVQPKSIQRGYGVNAINTHSVAHAKTEARKAQVEFDKRKRKTRTNSQQAWIDSDPYAKVKNRV